MLSIETIKELQELFKKEYGYEANSQEITALVEYFDLLAKIHAREFQETKSVV